MALNVFCSFDINKYPLQSIGYKLVSGQAKRRHHDNERKVDK